MPDGSAMNSARCCPTQRAFCGHRFRSTARTIESAELLTPSNTKPLGTNDEIRKSVRMALILRWRNTVRQWTSSEVSQPQCCKPIDIVNRSVHAVTNYRHLLPRRLKFADLGGIVVGQHFREHGAEYPLQQHRPIVVFNQLSRKKRLVN